MTGFPGPRPMTGDTALITVKGSTSTSDLTITGHITCQGLLRDHCGLVELTLPNADPQQRRALEHGTRYIFDLIRGAEVLYTSPELVVREVHRRPEDGALVVTGSP
ncbi:hypothetical protein ACFQ61_09405 [Streptomyces sp. NPDC056500]|uniref:hypothetical protein n=1 Tax=Streptomyces sp. NPDC056500 TaxID=3345840 RepID=UPI0036870A0C